jgi:hypothetical protein
MLRKKTHRVVFASGILFVLSLAIFGSLIAVAWMSMNSSMAVSADSYSFDFAAEEEFAIASRLGNDAPVIHSRLGNDAPEIHSRLDPGIVTSVDYKDGVVMIKARLDPNDVPKLHRQLDPDIVTSVDYKDGVVMIKARLDPNDVPILHSRLGGDAPVLHSRLGNDLTELDYKDYVLRIDYKQYVRSMEYKSSSSESGSSSSGRISDYSFVWQMIRTTH